MPDSQRITAGPAPWNAIGEAGRARNGDPSVPGIVSDRIAGGVNGRICLPNLFGLGSVCGGGEGEGEGEGSIAGDYALRGTSPGGATAVGREIDADVAALSTAQIAFQYPKSVRIHEPIELTFMMSFNQTEQVLTRALGAALPIESHSITAGPEMLVTLTKSPGLEITPLQADSPQAVPSHGVTYWKWRVEGTEGGSHVMTFQVFAVIADAPGMPKYPLKTFEETLKVEVTGPEYAWEFVRTNWQWLWTVLVVPVAGLLWRYLKPQSGEKGPTGADRPWKRAARRRAYDGTT